MYLYAPQFVVGLSVLDNGKSAPFRSFPIGSGGCTDSFLVSQSMITSLHRKSVQGKLAPVDREAVVTVLWLIFVLSLRGLEDSSARYLQKT